MKNRKVLVVIGSVVLAAILLVIWVSMSLAQNRVAVVNQSQQAIPMITVTVGSDVYPLGTIEDNTAKTVIFAPIAGGVFAVDGFLEDGTVVAGQVGSTTTDMRGVVVNIVVGSDGALTYKQ
ncbi:MAG: hypothetical protein IPK16_04090 [Anaerolineales bacterium]|nr:hypothetical protein [Anaerolineales bacterium]